MASIHLKWFNAQQKSPPNMEWVMIWIPFHPTEKVHNWLKVCEYLEDIGYKDEQRKIYCPHDFRKMYWCRWKSPKAFLNLGEV